jgi:hypothetical protein
MPVDHYVIPSPGTLTEGQLMSGIEHVGHIDFEPKKGEWGHSDAFGNAALPAFTECDNVGQRNQIGGLMGSDFSSGLSAGFAAARRTRADADQAVGDWRIFATNLQSKLLREQTERAVAVEYVRALRAQLKLADPNNSLLNESVANKLLDDTRVRKYAEQGYQLDSSTGSFVKVR